VFPPRLFERHQTILLGDRRTRVCEQLVQTRYVAATTCRREHLQLVAVCWSSYQLKSA